jgi:hypothetical protein
MSVRRSPTPRGDEATTAYLLELLAQRHVLGTSCVNIAEIDRGI